MLSEILDYGIRLSRKRDKKSSRKMTREQLVGEVWPEIVPSFQIHPGAKIFTIGSCFARNIEEHLQRLGFKIPMLDFKVPLHEWSPRPNGILNKYTPAAIFQEISWAKSLFLKGGAITEADSMVFFYDCGGGSCIDTNLGGYVPVCRERYFQRRSEIYDTFKEAFSSDCVVITLGLIEAWFDREKGIYIQHGPVGKHFARNGARFAFERLGYDQSCRFVQTSIDAIREVNSNAKFLLTVSPVPLVRTFAKDDVIVANAYSKSLLRAVAGEIAASNEYVDYFPAYETVMLTKNADVWKADLIHVSDAFVDKIVARLVETYCPGVATTQI